MQAYADAYPHMLSGGEQQRVALARAVAPRPGVILMDEPFSNLDRRMRDAVREETVALLREMGATTIIVTHDPEEAMRIADRVVLMRGGRDRAGRHGGRALPSARPTWRPPASSAISTRSRAWCAADERIRRSGSSRAGPAGRRAGGRLHPAAGASGCGPPGFCLPGPRAVAALPRRGRSAGDRRAGARRADLRARLRARSR